CRSETCRARSVAMVPRHFFFQAEDGIRDFHVTGVQTCALPIYGLGDRSPVNPATGQPVAGPETLSDAELAANRADLRRAILSHPLDGEYHRERSPVWSRITVPLLSAANWGGQGLHPRGNFEGFMRAASPEKW